MIRYIAAPWRMALIAGVATVSAVLAPRLARFNRVLPQALLESASTTQCEASPSYWFNNIRGVVIGVDSLNIELRQLYDLPAVSENDVTTVTDSATCSRGARALALSLDPPDTLTQRTVSVIRIGPTRFVVTDTSVKAGEFINHYVFDSSFAVPPLSVISN